MKSLELVAGVICFFIVIDRMSPFLNIKEIVVLGKVFMFLI